MAYEVALPGKVTRRKSRKATTHRLRESGNQAGAARGLLSTEGGSSKPDPIGIEPGLGRSPCTWDESRAKAEHQRKGRKREGPGIITNKTVEVPHTAVRVGFMEENHSIGEVQHPGPVAEQVGGHQRAYDEFVLDRNKFEDWQDSCMAEDARLRGRHDHEVEMGNQFEEEILNMGWRHEEPNSCQSSSGEGSDTSERTGASPEPDLVPGRGTGSERPNGPVGGESRGLGGEGREGSSTECATSRSSRSRDPKARRRHKKGKTGGPSPSSSGPGSRADLRERARANQRGKGGPEHRGGSPDAPQPPALGAGRKVPDGPMDEGSLEPGGSGQAWQKGPPEEAAGTPSRG